jgi:hypothetical protein
MEVEHAMLVGIAYPQQLMVPSANKAQQYTLPQEMSSAGPLT